MVFKNPFLDLQAYESSDDEELAPDVISDGESAAGGDDAGERQWNILDDHGAAIWEDEDAPVDDDPNHLTGPDFLDDMERRYDPENRLKSKSLVLSQTNDDILDNPTLHSELITKAILTSETKQLFWQLKCTPGQEIQVVFDIMNNFLPSVSLTATQYIDLFATGAEGDVEDLEDILKAILDVDSIPDSLRPMIDEAVAKKEGRFGNSLSSPHLRQSPHPESRPHSRTASERAFQYLYSFAQSDSTIPEAEEELKKILQLDSLPSVWLAAIDKAGLEPGVNPQVVFEALNAMKGDLVPLSQEAATTVLRPQPTEVNSVHVSPHSTATDVHHVFAAFSVPDVSGSVYLEADLGEDPQNTPIVEFLRQHPAVFKAGNVRLDRKSSLYHRQVWLRPIPPPEVGELLNLSLPSIKPFSWVKITQVLVVPRLLKESPAPPLSRPHPNHPLARADISTGPHEPERSDTGRIPVKRKREHPLPQRLFAKNEWKEGEGVGEWTQLGPNSYRMDKHEFQYDLLCCYLPYTSVTDVDVRMDTQTRYLFRASRHPALQGLLLPLPEHWVFYHNEPVEVTVSAPLTDQQKGDPSLPRATYRKRGRIEQIESERCLVHLEDYDDDVPDEYTIEDYGVKNLRKKDVEDTDIWVSKLNLQKIISVGDHIETMAGAMQGHYGFVVSRRGLEMTVVEMGSVQQKHFIVDANSCRLIQARNDVTIPWLNQRITVVRGQHRGHTGIVADVSTPPVNGYTMVDVRLSGLGEAVCLRHDDVIETCTKKPLYQALPLLPHQQGFRQASWGTAYAPTVTRPAMEGGRIVPAHEYLFLQQRPPEPWLDKLVIVIKGPIKNKGFVRGVELFHRFKSGMRVLVEFDYISAEHGANPRSYVDYGFIRDPDTSLPLHIRYPLSSHERRYWRPLAKLRAVSVPAMRATLPPCFQPLPPPSHSKTPLGHDLGGANPFHWSVDVRLDGKSFLAFYKSSDPLAENEKDVIVTPNSTLGYVSCTRNGREHWRALPQEILLPGNPAQPIKPQYNTKPLLVVRGEHTGKHIRQIYFLAQKGSSERLITASVFEPWGEAEEDRREEHIVVRSEDCAVVPNDPNKKKWTELMKSLRAIASQKRQR
ncbi:hypothetical protein VKT23_016688 [Stygiomarasmius scandens]|uniref:Chromatin elongation factor SPT5 n=1 Tax=Marasmiellus scandens TaxID=2682957 RepID=A0ABR1IUF2_9AGAR